MFRIAAIWVFLSAGVAAWADAPSGALLDRIKPPVVAADALLNRLNRQGFVNDFAGVLPLPQRDALEQRARDLQQKTGAELAVVTVSSLEGSEIEDFTHKLFNRWGIGQADGKNGVMLLVAMVDRQMQIEVGNGLEPILPDALADRIIEEELFPQFREKQYAEGLARGTQRIAEIIESGMSPAQSPKAASPIPQGSRTPLPAQLGQTVFFTLVVSIGLLCLGIVVGRLVSRFYRGRGRRSGRSRT
jgi:uncharacterized protein